MNNIDETIKDVTNNFEAIKVSFEKLSALITDVNKCESDYTKTIILSAIKKLTESIGLKDLTQSN
jgi:hypothetical protein